MTTAARKVEFPTFFHISEYGEEGYANLHGMIAASEPLNLWAPSSLLLKQPGCPVPQGDFVDLVDLGHIRVLGREQWLTSPAYRDNHPWPGARWQPAIDGPLLKICQEDATKPAHLRRVAIAPPEAGWAWADTFIEEPGQLLRWTKILRSRKAAATMPEGTLQAAERAMEESGSYRDAVRSVLRDIWNHAAAFTFSAASVPYNQPEHDQFMRLLASIRVSPNIAAPLSLTPTQMRVERDLADATTQLLDVLAVLSTTRRPTKLVKFVENREREHLVRWFGSYCEEIKATKPASVDKQVVMKVAEIVNAGNIRVGVKELLRHPINSGIGTASLAIGVIGAAVDPANLLGLAGLGGSVFPIGAGFCQVLGWAPAAYDGEQWPFLFAYGRAATVHRQRELAERLARLLPPRSSATTADEEPAGG